METGKDSTSKEAAGERTRENVGLLLNAAGELVTDVKDCGAWGILASVFTSKTDLQESQAPEAEGKAWNKKYLPLVEDDQARERFNWM